MLARTRHFAPIVARISRSLRPSRRSSALVLPFLGIADAGLGLDVVEPGVFHAFAVVQTFLQVTEQVWQPMHLSRLAPSDLRADLHGLSPVGHVSGRPGGVA